MKYFASNLLHLKKKMGYTQEDLAYKLMVSRQSISKWERSEAYPDIENIIEIAKLYGVTIDQLLTEDLSIPLAVESQRTTPVDDHNNQTQNSQRGTPVDDPNKNICEGMHSASADESVKKSSNSDSDDTFFQSQTPPNSDPQSDDTAHCNCGFDNINVADAEGNSVVINGSHITVTSADGDIVHVNGGWLPKFMFGNDNGSSGAFNIFGRRKPLYYIITDSTVVNYIPDGSHQYREVHEGTTYYLAALYCRLSDISNCINWCACPDGVELYDCGGQKLIFTGGTSLHSTGDNRHYSYRKLKRIFYRIMRKLRAAE